MWFRVDDTLHTHRKVRSVRRSGGRSPRDIAPMGLWVIAGSWCSSNPTSRGFIPAEVVEDWDDNALDLAERLVSAGLWEHAEQDNEQGFRFHDWTDYVPGQANSAESGRRGNHIRWHEKAGKIDPECPLCVEVIAPDSGGRSGGDSGGRSRTRTRPVPVPVPKNTPADGTPSTAFADFWAAYPRKVGKGAAEKAWKVATKSTDPAVILAGLRAQLPTIAMQRRTDGDFRPFPATWLNQARWEDDVDPSPTSQRSPLMPEAW